MHLSSPLYMLHACLSHSAVVVHSGVYLEGYNMYSRWLSVVMECKKVCGVHVHVVGKQYNGLE